MSLRDIYRTMETPGKNELNELQDKLNKAVLDAYEFGTPKSLLSSDNLQMLLNLNLKCYTLECEGVTLISPGLPEFIINSSNLFSEYCINISKEVV